jgi:multiple RNA-binding domain-containing protein 1
MPAAAATIAAAASTEAGSAVAPAAAGSKSTKRKHDATESTTAPSTGTAATAGTAAAAAVVPEEMDSALRREYERDQRLAAIAEAEAEETSETMESGRLFLRNLSYTVTEKDLTALFEPFGAVAEVHVPMDDMKKPKGFAYVSRIADKWSRSHRG